MNVTKHNELTGKIWEIANLLRGPYRPPQYRLVMLPHVPDAWVDRSKTKIGYEIPINRHFSVYKPPRPLEAIEANIQSLEGEIAGLLKGLVE